MGIDSDILAMIERDIGFATGNISAVMVFDSQDITGVKGAEFNNHEITEEGERIFREFEFVAKFSDFAGGTLPSQRETVEVDNVKVYVMDYDNPSDAMVVFRLRRAT